MIPPFRPADSLQETQRIADLHSYAIMDTAPEAIFERVTKMASRLLSVPISVISLIESERQWFKSCYGLDVKEMERDKAFCAHTILSTDVMVVPDTTHDPRFAANPLVTGPTHIRAYAGVPLTSPEGHNIGALAVLDTATRQFSGDEIVTLCDLAAQVMDGILLRRVALNLADENMERKRAEEALQESNNLLRAVIEGSEDAIFVKDLESRYLMMNTAGARYRGKTPEEIIGKSDSDLFSPETAQLLIDTDRLVLESGTTKTFEQTISEDGETRTHLVTKGIFYNQQGQPAGIFGVAREVTLIKRFESELAAREKRFRMLSEHSGDGLVLTDRAGNCQYLSRSASRILGYGEHEVMSHSVFGYIHPDDQQAMEAALAQLLQQPGGSVTTECRVRHRDGSWRWTENVGTNLLAEPSVNAIVGNFRDITSRKDTEAALRAIEKRFEAFMNHSPVVAFIKDEGGRYLYVNDPVERVFQFKLSEVVGSTDFDFLPELTARQFRDEDLQVLATNEVREFINILPSVYGQRRSLVIKFPIDEGNGQQLLGGMAIDITELTRSQERLKRSEAQLAEAQQTAHLGSWDWDIDANIITWSDELFRLFGAEPGEFEITPEIVFNRIHPDDREMAVAVKNKAVSDCQPFEFDCRIIRTDGAVRIQHTIGKIGVDENNQVDRLFGSVQDVTAIRQTEFELKQAKLEAERANRAKSEFLSRMSHELRTPLNAILGFAQLFDPDELAEEERENVEEILRAGRHLLHLINEVLDIARIEAGRLALSLEAVNVRESLDEITGLIKPLASERGIHIENMSEANSYYVRADRHKLKQVLLNLVSNAVKYNRRGGNIYLSCAETNPEDRSVFPGAEASPWISISIRDTGSGIAEKNLDKIFDPFERLDAQSTTEGSGLGLAISKRLVELMCGVLDVRSVEGQGSTFRVQLPRMSDPLSVLDSQPPFFDITARESLPAARSQKTVLYIEDNLSNLKLIERILEHRPEITLIAAMQGIIGVDLANEHHPDLILLDLHLPDILGDEVLRRLQAGPETQNIPVVMISADATVGQAERLRNGGAVEYLTKPLDVQRFLQVLQQLLSDSSADKEH